jgi:lipopolysaccharide transport system permease protein
MQTKIYSPEPALKHPSEFFRMMWADIRASRELAIALAMRDIKVLYRQSILGYIWAFLPVLGTTGVFLFLRSGGALTTLDSGIAYPVYLLIGTILWQVFADAVNGPLKVVTSSRAMIVKINFPREALILAGMLITCFNFLVRLLVLVPALIFFAWKGSYIFTWESLYLFPLGVVAVILLGYAIGVLLTPIGMLYKDVGMGVQMVLMFWMFMTPVVLTIPESGLLATVMRLNPVSSVLDTARSWLVGIEPTFLLESLIVLGCSLFFLVIGWILYRVALPHVIARLGM